jgi:MscS family membrane protein
MPLADATQTASQPAATQPAGGGLLDFLTTNKYLGNELWRWVALFGLLLAALIAGKAVSYFLQSQADGLKRSGRHKVAGAFLQSIAGPVTLVLLGLAFYLAARWELVLLEETVSNFWLGVSNTVIALGAGWFVFRVVDVVEVLLRRWSSRSETLLDDQLVPLIRKTLRILVVIVVAMFIAQNIFAWNIQSILAGLGIGGLAVALAAKDTLSNLFGSVTIFADRPFAMGDFIEVDGKTGVVEEVGFRSTRIRMLTGNQLIVPNSVIASQAIENIGRRPSIRRVLEISVTYDTPPDKLARGVEIVKGMLAARSDHWMEDMPPRVYFSEFAAANLTIVVYYWFTPAVWWDYMEFNHAFNMELLERFNAEGIEFAFPTQTLYLKKES